MKDNIIISNTNNNYIFNQKDKNSTTRSIASFSLKNIDKKNKTYISNDRQMKKNLKENPRKIDLNEFLEKTNNGIIFKTTNNYYPKKNYQKFLNIPQYGSSINKNLLFSKNNINQNSYNNIYSNLNLHKTYNKLSIKELNEITQKRKKIINDKYKKEKLQKEKLLKEQEKLRKIILGIENVNPLNDNLCEDGVQTSTKIKKVQDNGQAIIQNEKNEDKEEEKIFYDKKNNINTNNKNSLLKNSRNTETDLVNIGNETVEINDKDSSNKDIIDINNNNNINNKELSFTIENNDTILSNKKNEEYTLSFENEIKNEDNLKQNNNYQKEKGNNDNLSKSSSYKENEISEVEEYDINKVNLQNETKSNIFDSINYNNVEENINLGFIKDKNILSTGKDRYEDNNNPKNIIYNNNSIEKEKKSINIINEINDKNLSKNKNVNQNDEKIKSNKYFHRKKLNSCNGRFNNNIIINRQIINIGKQILLSSNLNDNSLNIKNNNNFKIDPFRKNTSSINIKSKHSGKKAKLIAHGELIIFKQLLIEKPMEKNIILFLNDKDNSKVKPSKENISKIFVKVKYDDSSSRKSTFKEIKNKSSEEPIKTEIKNDNSLDDNISELIVAPTERTELNSYNIDDIISIERIHKLKEMADNDEFKKNLSSKDVNSLKIINNNLLNQFQELNETYYNIIVNMRKNNAETKQKSDKYYNKYQEIEKELLKLK